MGGDPTHAPGPDHSLAELPFDVPEEGELFDGKHRVIRKLGQGGMGVVLHALDEQLSRDVAIKLIRPDYFGDKNAARYLLAEARAMASIRHPNIVEIHAYGECKGIPYLVMEYIDGCDLYQWLLRHEDQVVTIDEAIGVMSQVCQGVEALHDQGLVHQDLKPANVLVGPDFRVAVTDFGLASFVRQAAMGGLELPIGTPPFTAPEVVRGDRIQREYARRVDVYALGAIAYQLLTGCYMFPIEDTKRLFHYQTDYDPVAPSSVRPELPPAFDRVILEALHRDPEQRIPSAQAFHHALLNAREVTHSRSIAPTRVVIVDDDPVFLRWLRATMRLVAPEVEILEASNGREALALVRHRRPALVITDLQMPEMNGIELTAALRGDPVTQDIPVIVTTAVGGAAEWRTLERLQADAYLTKPFSKDTLAINTRRFLRRNTAPQP